MKQVQNAEEISNIAFGFMASKALFVALHCNLFSLLSKRPLTSVELAGEVKVPENRISTICTALTSIGLLKRKNGKYSNSIGAEKYLVKDAKYDFGDYLRLQIDRQMYGFMQQLEGVVTNNMNKDDID
ncbi:MAG: methyltransferase, partial [Alphaproteobacteria bacterium]|nr:methyltransferase [Alphaproteobacteria bacterium]